MRTICWNNLKKCHQISMMIIAKIVLLVATFLQQLLPIMSKMAPETEAVKILGKLPTFSRLCKTTLLLRWQQIMKAIRPTVDADVYQESVSLPIIYCILTLCTMGWNVFWKYFFVVVHDLHNGCCWKNKLLLLFQF